MILIRYPNPSDTPCINTVLVLKNEYHQIKADDD